MHYPPPSDDPASHESPPPYDPNFHYYEQGAYPYGPPPYSGNNGYGQHPGYGAPPYEPYGYGSQQQVYAPPPPPYGQASYGYGRQQQAYAPPPPYGQQAYGYGMPPYGRVTPPPAYAQWQMPQYYFPVYSMPKASFGRRLAARIIDGFIMFCGFFGMLMMAGILFALHSSTAFYSVIIAFVGLIGYEVFFTGKYGATPGKKLLKLKVVNKYGQIPGYGPAIGRWLVQGLVSAQIFYLGYLWMLWDPQGQTWHDKIAGTYVVEDRT